MGPPAPSSRALGCRGALQDARQAQCRWQPPQRALATARWTQWGPQALSPAPLTVSPGEMRSALSGGLLAPVGHVRPPVLSLHSGPRPPFHWSWWVTRPHLSSQRFPPADPRGLAGGLREGAVAGLGSQPARGKLTPPLRQLQGARNQV